MTDREARELAIQCKATGEGLYGMMQKRPELFTHIKQERVRKKPEQWVVIAEKLAKENGGTVPCGHWLNNNGYSGLALVMRIRPELFAHIKQEKIGRKPEDWVPIAEKLAKENGGTLQNAEWLRKNGYSALNRAMQKRPELFAHIKQKKMERKPEDWVVIAEKLAKENGGTLPCGHRLKNNGYGGLNKAMKVRPELFAHIKQDKGRRNPEDWVPVAEKLAKENGGTVPCGHWLNNNGYSGLYVTMQKRPELFSHIKQDKGRRNPEDWVPIAEKLAKENGGTLQNAKWLKKNGYGGMSQAMRRHPELFAHIMRSRKAA